MRLVISVPLLLAGAIVVLFGLWGWPNEAASGLLRVAFWVACATAWVASLALDRNGSRR